MKHVGPAPDPPLALAPGWRCQGALDGPSETVEARDEGGRVDVQPRQPVGQTLGAAVVGEPPGHIPVQDVLPSRQPPHVPRRVPAVPPRDAVELVPRSGQPDVCDQVVHEGLAAFVEGRVAVDCYKWRCELDSSKFFCSNSALDGYLILRGIENTERPAVFTKA